MRAANGTELEIAGEALLPLTIDEQFLLVMALVTHDVDEIMLGLNFLTSYNCIWFFGQGEIFINDKMHTAFAHKGARRCRRIFVAEDIIIPPRHEANVVARSTITSLKHDTGMYVTKPKAIQKGVYSGRVLLPQRHHDIAVRAINTSSQPHFLRKDTFLGELEPVTVDKVCPITEQPVEMATELASVSVINNLPAELTIEQRQQAANLIQSYEDVFSQHDHDIGRTHLMEHTIDTGDHHPIRQSLRRHPHAHLEFIDREVDEMLRHGIVEPAASPWAANVVIARKKDGELRLCLDYRNLNNLTYQDSYPLPHIDTCVNSLKNASWFSTLDLRSGYYNVPIAEQDKDKTAFITRRGQWRFNVMPFGLTAAPSRFQRLMDLVLVGLTYDACMVYLDDVIIFAPSYESHLQRLQQVFERIRQAGLKLKGSKCSFFQRKVEFLGHVISENGVGVLESKVSAVKTWPVPLNLHEVRSFTGFCSYYRRFIEGFAQIAAPLHELTRKNVRFHWGPDQ